MLIWRTERSSYWGFKLYPHQCQSAGHLSSSFIRAVGKSHSSCSYFTMLVWITAPSAEATANDSTRILKSCVCFFSQRWESGILGPCICSVNIHHWATFPTLNGASKSDLVEKDLEGKKVELSLITSKHDFQSSDCGNALLILHITLTREFYSQTW